MSEISFDVRGIAVPQGSKNSHAWRDKASGNLRSCTYDQKSEKLKTWRTAIAQEARAELRRINEFLYQGMDNVDTSYFKLLNGALEVGIQFTFQPSKSRLKLLEKKYGKGKEWYPHEIKPDLDKLQRAVGDALTGVVFTDDCQIWRYSPAPEKIFSMVHPPGCKITVRTC